MKGRETRGAPSADLLVCFPSRVQLTVMPPKHICSPARPSEPNKHHHHYRLLKKSSTRKGGGAGGGQASPLLWAKNKQMGSEITEPTSPKVTCAGQIKVGSKTSSCKSWQSVMEEIERIHCNRIHRKRRSWVESLGFKKEVMHSLTCLRSIRFDFRCFGSFPQSDITTDDEDEDEEYQENDNYVQGNETSRTIFSKWFMVLQEDQSNGFYKEEDKEKDSSLDHVDDKPAVPPANALLLMRCRSAPANSWLESNRVEENKENVEKGDEEGEKLKECKRKDEGKRKNLRSLMEEESKKMKESLAVMKYDPDFNKISTDIVQETWLVGGMKDPLSRSRSWKR
ncbi:hypothetical protein F3Y22_tig00005246pilonHSYRG00005 [Hibiscus syriacus]|uniref:Uncharacterized protein n=1 Tax=Hibiscus syriacus TaxID=106335 RepID=A0A6A3CLA4_HIBSY|nr:uncharacterized protein LOC120198981 [Hibiscus syriacus]KAE8727889.1 hypothetical protein F3Y22_tig00005246pilonHSYRG00005 [Hibiscus syriacus]